MPLLFALMSSLFLPSNAKFAKTVVLSEITDDSPDLQANRRPLLCTVHFSLIVCVIMQSPDGGRSFFCWILLNVLCCPKPRSTWRKPATEFHFCYLKDLLPCAVRSITQHTLIQLFKCKEAKRCCDLSSVPSSTWLMEKTGASKLPYCYDTTLLILSLLFTNTRCFLGIHKQTPKSAITV